MSSQLSKPQSQGGLSVSKKLVLIGVALYITASGKIPTSLYGSMPEVHVLDSRIGGKPFFESTGPPTNPVFRNDEVDGRVRVSDVLDYIFGAPGNESGNLRDELEKWLNNQQADPDLVDQALDIIRKSEHPLLSTLREQYIGCN